MSSVLKVRTNDGIRCSCVQTQKAWPSECIWCIVWWYSEDLTAHVVLRTQTQKAWLYYMLCYVFRLWAWLPTLCNVFRLGKPECTICCVMYPDSQPDCIRCVTYSDSESVTVLNVLLQLQTQSLTAHVVLCIQTQTAWLYHMLCYVFRLRQPGCIIRCVMYSDSESLAVLYVALCIQTLSLTAHVVLCIQTQTAWLYYMLCYVFRLRKPGCIIMIIMIMKYLSSASH